MQWVRAFLAIALGLIALRPARAALRIAGDIHTPRWPQSITRWALVNRLYLMAFYLLTIYVYAVLGVNSIATIALLVCACAALVLGFLHRAGRLAERLPRTRRVLGCVQCSICLAPLVLLSPSEPKWPLSLYLVITVPGTMSLLALGKRPKQDREFARFLVAGR